jgi:hypothetical protein
MSDFATKVPAKVPGKRGPKGPHAGLFKPGDPRIYRGGRPPGTPGKAPKAFKDVVVEAVMLMGGASGLVDWARRAPENEFAFWTEIAPRILPKIIEGNPDAPIPLQVIERRIIDPPDDILDVDAVDVVEE